MGYCSTDSVKSVKSVKRLLVPEGTWTDADIAARIDEIGTSVIDTRLGGVYSVPFEPVPDVVERICRLKTAYGMLMEEYGREDDRYEFLNEEAEYLLRGLEKKVFLLESPESVTGVLSGPELFSADARRYFDMEGGGL